MYVCMYVSTYQYYLSMTITHTNTKTVSRPFASTQSHAALVDLCTYPHTHTHIHQYKIRVATIRFDSVVCGTEGAPPCKAKADLHIEVYCPPYVAPDHGYVVYKGKTYHDATAKTPAAREYWKVMCVCVHAFM
jgi:hypothetical protein